MLIGDTKYTKKELELAFLLCMDESLSLKNCKLYDKEGNSACYEYSTGRCDECMITQYINRVKSGELPNLLTLKRCKTKYFVENIPTGTQISISDKIKITGELNIEGQPNTLDLPREKSLIYFSDSTILAIHNDCDSKVSIEIINEGHRFLKVDNQNILFAKGLYWIAFNHDYKLNNILFMK
ncbi:hypothetical protein [Clostridium perfringens]|uniref:Uncharacterized protein n=1 Tax=Clostridium perfringens TaxID=1502 RepID=A0A140GRC0_CLOPF|nr:hypothetical protein [Clostridium perfringens]AMN31079.1 hypothetical protein JFP838_pA0163 [Clostridium perfringens]